MPSDLLISLVATSERILKGKVRKILLRNGRANDLAVIAIEGSSSSPPTLRFCDKGETQTVKLEKNFLELSWVDNTDKMNSDPLLVILYEDGQVCTYPVNFEHGNVLGVSVADLERQVERPPGKAYGSLDCFGPMVAFSLGKDVYAYSTSSNVADATFSLEEALRLGTYTPGRLFVTTVCITATNHVLVFVAGTKQIIEYDLATKSILRNVVIQDNPSTVAISRTTNLILLHDAVWGAYFYSLDTLRRSAIPPIEGAQRLKCPVPVCFGSRGQLAVIGDTNTIRVADLSNPTVIKNLTTNGKRTLALKATNDTEVSVIAAVVPEAGGWEIQTWTDQQRSDAASESSSGLAAGSIENRERDTVVHRTNLDTGNVDTQLPSASMKESIDILQEPSSVGESSKDKDADVPEEPLKERGQSNNTSDERINILDEGLSSPPGEDKIQCSKHGRSPDSAYSESFTATKCPKTVFSGYIPQPTTCTSSIHHRPCLTCSTALAADEVVKPEECRFINFRWFKDDSPSDPFILGMSLTNDSRPFGLYEYHEWEPSRTEAHESVIKHSTAVALISHLRDERKHLNHEECLFRRFPRDTSYTCDKCSMGLFFAVWFCRSCGQELCKLCYRSLPRHSSSRLEAGTDCTLTQHSQNCFVPVSSFTEEEVEQAVKDMEQLICTLPRRNPVKLASIPRTFAGAINFNPRKYGRDVNRFTKAELLPVILDDLLTRCEPFIIIDAFKPDTPKNLLELDDLKPHPCFTTFWEVAKKTWWVKEPTTLEAYFCLLWDEESKISVQVQDYPPNGNLRDVHPRLYDRFFDALEPFKEFMGPRGPLNLFSYHPKDGLPPDLGPKLYISQPDADGIGTTFIHMDKSGAINIMLHSEDEGHGTGAHWDIWPKSEIPNLSKALNPHASSKLCATGQPIITEKFYARPELLEKQYSQTGYHHWSFDQLPGEAVVIPPGCPHQVSNRGKCIKIACDFISPSQIEVLEDLEGSFQRMNSDSTKAVHTDLLQLKMLLWYAWNSSRASSFSS